MKRTEKEQTARFDDYADGCEWRGSRPATHSDPAEDWCDHHRMGKHGGSCDMDDCPCESEWANEVGE